MDYEIYKYSIFKRILIRIKDFIKNLGLSIKNFLILIGKLIFNLLLNIYKVLKNLINNFINGDIVTKISYFIMGFGHLFRHHIIKGLIFLVLEIGFLCYMVFFGGNYLSMFFQNFFNKGDIGRVETSDYWNEELGIFDKITGDNSFHIVLYGILSIFVIVCFIIVYIAQTTESYNLEQNNIIGKKTSNIKKDINNLLDNKFQYTLLTLPMIGLFLFTVIPLITMILIAFTNYDANHEVPQHLFQWVGFTNFKELFGSNSALGSTFWRVLAWTLIWAVLATFTSYFFGMLLALLINKKGIKLKKLYRTLFVSTIAVPQFVSLLIMSKI